MTTKLSSCILHKFDLYDQEEIHLTYFCFFFVSLYGIYCWMQTWSWWSSFFSGRFTLVVLLTFDLVRWVGLFFRAIYSFIKRLLHIFNSVNLGNQTFFYETFACRMNSTKICFHTRCDLFHSYTLNSILWVENEIVANFFIVDSLVQFKNC